MVPPFRCQTTSRAASVLAVSHRSYLLAGASTLALLSTFWVAAPSSAADTTVGTIGEFQTALADCAAAPNTITLGADISSPGATLMVGCDTTIDLGTHDLAVRNVVIDAGRTLEVTGPTDGSEGTFTVDASSENYIAGIQTTGATLLVSGGSVVASAGANGSVIGGALNDSAGTLRVTGGSVSAYAGGNPYGTAIGGGYLAGDGGSVEITGGTVYAEITSVYGTAIGGGGAGASGQGGRGADVVVTSGTLTAVATGGSSTAIGGGVAGVDASDRGGAGGSLTIGSAGTVTASSPRSALGGGRDGSSSTSGDFGTVQVDGVLQLPSGGLVLGTDPVPGAEITVGPTGRILGSDADPATGATIAGPGSIVNNGVIALSPPAEAVSGNNRLITFDSGEPSVRVFAPSIGAGYRALPAPPAAALWNTAVDGSGAWFTDTSPTDGTGTTTLYAVPTTLQVSSDPVELTATAGTPYEFPVTVLDPTGAPLDPQPSITYTSTDCTIVGGEVFETAGPCTITASAVVSGATLEATFDITVAPGALDVLAISPSDSTVDQGGSLEFTVTGADAYGNAVDASAATLSSSVDTDVIAGHTVTFPHASPHTITATLGGVTASTTVEVTPTAALPPADPAPPRPAALPRIGSDISPVTALGTAALLLSAAGVTTLIARRRAG